MNLYSGFLVLMIFFAAVIAGAEPRPEIQVQSQVDVPEHKNIQIMDIAKFGTMAPDIAAAAMEIMILPAPKDGESRTYRNNEIIKILKSKINDNDMIGDLSWSYFIPDSVQVTGHKMPISSLSAENQIRNAMLKQCRDCNVKIKNLKVPNFHEPIVYKDCSLQTDGVKLTGTFLLPVQCHTNTYWVSGTASISKMAPVATRQIHPGDPITAADFRKAEVDLTFAKDGVAQDKDLVGQVAARPIFVNQPIFRGDLRKEIAVFRGQPVRTLLGDENFEVSSSGTAEEQGSVGDTVRVKNSDTQKIMAGVVVEKGLVRLQ